MIPGDGRRTYSVFEHPLPGLNNKLENNNKEIKSKKSKENLNGTVNFFKVIISKFIKK